MKVWSSTLHNYYAHLERFLWSNQCLQQIVGLWYLSTNGILIGMVWRHENITIFSPPPFGMRRLSQIGSKSSPLSQFSFGFKVLIWMISRILPENSLGSHSNTLMFSQSIWRPLLLMTCSLMADLELPAVDLCSLSLFSSFLADSPM